MDDTFTCDWCGQSVAVRKRGDAVVVKCPKCGKSLMVPPMPIQTKTTQTTTANTANPALSMVAQPQTPGSSQTKQCPFCAKPMSLEAEACKYCGFTPSSWNPQGIAEEDRRPNRKFSRTFVIILASVAIALLGIVIYLLMVAARR